MQLTKPKSLPQEHQETLDSVLAQLWKTEDLQRTEEKKRQFLELIADYLVQGYNIKHHWQEYKQYLKHISQSLILLLMVQQPQVYCQPQINEKGQLIEVTYKLIQEDNRKFLLPISKVVVKEQARPEDLRGYKCEKN